MDESGIHEGAHVCVIAGYWGTVKKWKKFENRWKAILRDANEPTLVEFHSVEFWNKNDKRRGVFARWSDDRADKFIDDLASCIVDAKVFPTACTVAMDDWNRLNGNERRFLRRSVQSKDAYLGNARRTPKTIFLAISGCDTKSGAGVR